MRLIQSRYSLVAFLAVKTEKSEFMRSTDTGGLQKLLFGYYKSQISDSEEPIQVTSSDLGWEKLVRTFHQSRRIDLDDQDSTCTAGLRGK